ncbi:SDR family NAD(P)-dependent oxidoreductase [Streptomyces sp. NPDC058284]|uniref:SDR family NAD(P)-dependent oxidoreductase n=1 Tax=unclassified Streptomyces TaxID=2593676 RepID=UPI003662FEAC
MTLAEHPESNTPADAGPLRFPASYAQQRMWFFHHLQRDNPYYNIPLALRWSGRVDVAALRLALEQVVARHEILRTTFTTQNGEPHQVVAPSGTAALDTVELAPEQERQWALDWVDRPFDLTRGPLLRAALITTGPDRHLLILCQHHIITDGWSLNLLTKELTAFYRERLTGEPNGLPALEIQYADFADWQRDRLAGDELERQLGYWRAQLSGDLPTLELPVDRPRPAEQTFRGARVDLALPAELTEALTALGRAHRATLFMTLFAGVSALLHRYTGQDAVLMGSPVAGRDQVETEALLGLFVNTLVLRGDLSGEPTFAQLLGRVRQMCTDAFAHQDVPLDRLVEELQPDRDASRTPLFQTLFALQSGPDTERALPGAQLRAEALPRASTRFDLEFHLWQDGGQLRGTIVYSTDLFAEATVRGLADHLHRLLAEAVRTPERPVSDLPLHDAEALPAPPALAPDTVPARLAAQTLRTPRATALTTGTGRHTYTDLAERVRAAAHWLHAQGLRHGDRAALCLPPGALSVTTALALLRLGVVCVPLDPATPEPAARAFIADSGASVLLTAGPPSWTHTPPVLDLTGLPVTRPDGADDPAGPPVRPTDPAVVVHGDHGPVPVTHAQLCDTVDWLQRRTPLTADDIVLHHRPDALLCAVHAILWPLLHGAAVHPAPSADDTPATVAFLPPTALATGAVARLRLVHTSGGLLTARLADRFHAATGAALHRLWPLPEAGGYVAALHCAPGLAGHELSTGEPGNRPAAVVDSRSRPLAPGIPGLLHVAAPERPFSWRCRRLPDGRIALDDTAGRVRRDGLGADPADIENALLREESLGACAVLARTTTDGVEELVAYVVPTGAFHPARLRDHARSLLPAPLVPSAYVAVTSLPRTRDGHLDEAALRALPVLDEELIRQWERALPSAKVTLTEDTTATSEGRVHTDIPGPHANDGKAEGSSGPLVDSAGSRTTTDATARPALSTGPGDAVPDVATLPEALHRAAARGGGGILLLDHQGEARELDYATLAAEAGRVLGGLRAAGLTAGDRALLQCPDHRDFLVAFWACVLGGIVPVPLAPITPGQDGPAADRLAGALELLGAPLVLTDGATATALAETAARRAWTTVPRLGILDELRAAAPGAPHPAGPDDVALLLLTSGSTGAPKAVALRHRNVLARSAATSAANGFGPGEVSFNWMPLDHVGGVVMFHVRDVYLGCRQVHAPTAWILQEPLRWLETVNACRATLTWAPNFAFGLVNDRVAEAAGADWDLSCLRFIQNAGEAIMPRVARRFLAALAPFGLPATAMRPSWGMSETSSAVTYSDAFTLATTSDDASFTEVGRPLPGTTLRIVDEHDTTLPEGTPGRLLVKGPTVTSGYHDNPEANRAAFTDDGWFDTGDLGVLRDGALTITGRAKDVLIINGVNHYCHEIESVVEELDGVENSFTAACAVRDPGATTDDLVLFVHLRVGPADPADAIREIRAHLVRRSGLNPRHVLPVDREEIPKTEIGKIQRSKLRDRFHAGDFADLIRATDLALGNERTLPNWFYERRWRPARPQRAPRSHATALVLTDRLGLADALLTRLAADGRTAARVDLGADHARIVPGHYRIRPDHRDDHDWLFGALAADGLTPGEIVDLTTYAPPAPADPDRTVPAATACLIHLVQALAAHRAADDADVTLRVAGRHTQHALPGDRPDCDRAARLALLVSLGQELSWLNASHLDLPGDGTPATDLTHLLAELDARPGEPEAAVREGRRLTPRLAQLPSTPAKTGSPLRRGGLYVVTGGLGGLGAEICAHLLDAYDARLLILGRTELPPDSAAPDDPAARSRLETLRSLRSRSDDVLYATADVCDPEQTRAALDLARARWSQEPCAVLHLAGTFRQQPFLTQSVDDLAGILAPKTTGTQVLLDCLADSPETVLIGFSSVNGTLGAALASAYAAANAHLDARAHQTGSPRVRSLAWSLWEETGMSRGHHLTEPSRARGYHPIGKGEGLRAFLHALRHDRPHVLVGLDASKPFIRSRLDAPTRPVHRLSAHTSAPPEPGAVTLPDRYGLATTCAPADACGDSSSGTAAAPAGPTQELVARTWCDVLHLDRVGPHDNFFDLGGHSLHLARVHNLLEAALERPFSMVDLFRHSTVASLAAFLDTPAAPPPTRAAAQARADRRQSARNRRRPR